MPVCAGSQAGQPVVAQARGDAGSCGWRGERGGARARRMGRPNSPPSNGPVNWKSHSSPIDLPCYQHPPAPSEPPASSPFPRVPPPPPPNFSPQPLPLGIPCRALFHPCRALFLPCHRRPPPSSPSPPPLLPCASAISSSQLSNSHDIDTIMT